nr:MAG TPA: hypothetical protein [Caudoviricetes sp.]
MGYCRLNLLESKIDYTKTAGNSLRFFCLSESTFYQKF